jgi:hypothetical protein
MSDGGAEMLPLTLEPLRTRWWHVLAVVCVTVAGFVASTGSSAEALTTTNGQVVYPYSCTTTFVGGASFSESSLQVGITDLLNAPTVHTYGTGGPIPTQLRVNVEVDPSGVSALLGTGTTDWTSTNASLVWGGVTSPAASFSWHISPVPSFSDRSPISFTTATFPLSVPGNISPGALSWDFVANPGVRAGFESGHVQCTPAAPVQIYSTWLPASGPSCLHDLDRWTCRFSYSGATQLWQVPPDVHQVTVDVRGASGAGLDRVGALEDIDKIWPGGRGGESVANLVVKPREYLTLDIGGTNGFNGGGAGAFDLPGGGGSDVRRAPGGLSQRLVIAGGGGAGGWDVSCFSGCPDDSGGAGGGLSGVGAGGGPGTQTSGGAAQPSGEPNVPSTPGSLGTGGNGATGGGGGYYGGGGGAPSTGLAQIGGGGGGSGFVPWGQGNTTLVGTNSGNGSISISYTSSSTPYTSRYTADEARWLLVDAAALHAPDLASAQHDAALFMTLLGAVIHACGGTAPHLGSAPGSGPIAVTSTYSRGENAALLHAATLFESDPPTVQRTGAAVLAFVIGKGGH